MPQSMQQRCLVAQMMSAAQAFLVARATVNACVHRTTHAKVPGAKICEVADDLVYSIVLAHTIVWAMTEGQEILLVFDVFLALCAKPVRIEFARVTETLQS